MKKLIVVPIVAVVAAVGAASAAGFAGGVSASAIQTGDANDLTCAASARVVEWGNNDHVPTPFVDSVKVQLNDAECQGQAVSVVALNPDGTEMAGRPVQPVAGPHQPGVRHAVRDPLPPGLPRPLRRQDH